MKELYFKIHGRVQGVGFRRFVLKNAQKIGGLSGWVRNAEDGTVEVLIKGKEELVEQMFQVCQKGSLFSRVDKITALPAVKNYFLPQIENGIFRII